MKISPRSPRGQAGPRNSTVLAQDRESFRLPQDPIHSIREILRDEIGRRLPISGMPLNFALSIAGTHEDGARSNAMSQLDIAVPVADNKGAAQIQAVLTCGALQHSRLRLAAGAANVSFVRTIVPGVRKRSPFGKLGLHPN